MSAHELIDGYRTFVDTEELASSAGQGLSSMTISISDDTTSSVMHSIISV
ncbi:hypothetical protein AB0I52_02175 [Streptomyces sp. NPDC050423]